ncbi:hypothetical protein QF026_008595 [Streptomyces aurantiacus]|uniref:hypothetical protein n=1 Tax=Streptomyces aurantiacus TaxID=47760 RepID=UPI00278FD4F3|nr:hypothetical protein [Streptomyces aurantiacus]MDQ0780129.1 hypothetical protein [Streptomyces aurantiacus]
MTTHTPRPPARSPSRQARIPRPRTSTLPPEATSLAPTLPPAFEAFCALNRDSYLDYARAHLPHQPARRLVRSVLGELAVRWTDIVSNPNPSARAWTLLRTHVHDIALTTGVLEACSAYQYDALVLHCLLGYSSTSAATAMGTDPSKVRYLVLSATAARRQAIRHLQPQPAAPHAA